MNQIEKGRTDSVLPFSYLSNKIESVVGIRAGLGNA